MAKSKKQSHTQRLVDSMKTIGTARTPISTAYPTGAKARDLPTRMQPQTKGVRSHNRILMPSDPPKIARTIARRPTATNPASGGNPSASYIAANRVLSYDPRRAAWDTRHPAYNYESAQFNTAVRNYNTELSQQRTYDEETTAITNRNKKAKTAASIRSKSKVPRTRKGIGKAIRSLKGSRSYSRSKGSR